VPDDLGKTVSPKTAKECDCLFRHDLSREWSRDVSGDELDAFVAEFDVATRAFEAKVMEMRALSREGAAQRLFDDRAYFMCPGARAAFLLARLLLADGHPAGARLLAEYALAHAGGAALPRGSVSALLASLSSVVDAT
jgi:hypothetical protein